VAAHVHNSRLERAAADEVSRRERVAEAESKVPARNIAALIHEADEVVIAYSTDKTASDNEVRFRDPIWRAELADVIERASFKATPHGFWVSTPVLRFNRNHQQTLEVMALGGTLRCYDQRAGGDFMVGEATVNALRKLVAKKSPTGSRNPARVQP
jgi:hypothetical protein